MTRTADPTADPYDKLAAMFLTDGNRPESDTPAVGAGPIELVVAGHLPVRGSIWLTPYADTVAQREGVTALIRLDGDESSVEVHGLPDRDAGLLEASGGRTVREAIMLLGPLVHTWIVRPTTNAEPTELLGTGPDPAADRITILSSADQAAVTNVYKLVKELATAARALGRDLPRLGVAMIGSPREKSALQARRIDATAREHLEVSVPMTLNIAQMNAVRNRCLRSFPGQARPALADVLSWISTARDRQQTAAPPPRLTPFASKPPESVEPQPPPSTPPISTSTPPPSSPPAPITESMSEGVERALEYGRTNAGARSQPPAARPPAPQPAQHRPSETAPPALGSPEPGSPEPRSPASDPSESNSPEPPRAASAPSSPSPADADAAPLEDLIRGAVTPPSPAAPPPRRATPVASPPRAVTEVEPKQASLPREPDRAGRPVPLATHVADTTVRAAPGAKPPYLKPLVARCPGHERIEIALDAAGHVHVLAREEDIRGLPVVQSWVRANRELLAMAHPDDAINPAAPTVPHVFASDPLRVADLHASPIQLHVLTPIDVDGRRAWYAAALNKPI